MIVWALFDSGNGCYTQGAELFNQSVDQSAVEIYPIGIDIESKNNHFINLNLADYSRMFGDNKLFDELDKLPKPDLIIASPPVKVGRLRVQCGGVMQAGNRKQVQ